MAQKNSAGSSPTEDSADQLRKISAGPISTEIVEKILEQVALSDPERSRPTAPLGTSVYHARADQQFSEHREDRIGTLLDRLFDAVITFDNQGIIRSVNLAALKMFGYPPKELIGQSIHLLLPATIPQSPEPPIKRSRSACESDANSIYREASARRKDGSIFPVEFTFNSILGPGTITGVIRDISDRKELQQQILNIAADEDRRIGHELHDGLQQELTGLELLAEALLKRLDLSQNELAADLGNRGIEESLFTALRKYAAEMCRGLAAAHLHLHRLCRGILPLEIDAKNLNQALAELANSTDALQNFRCLFKSCAPLEFIDGASATHLYRITQEAVNNALRHSRGDEILIFLSEQAGQLVLEIIDNGIGIDPTRSNPPSDPRTLSGIGLQAMRYRANLIKARLEIGPGKNRGTRVRCILHR